jgi:hypothetical protein
MFITDPNNRLSNFEDAITAFKKFPEGGFWVKKIIQRFGMYKESVLGPYKLSDAEKESNRWKKIFKYEDEEVAKVLSFKELVCGKKEENTLDDEVKWNPPKGARLICLIKKYFPLVVYPYDVIEGRKGNDFMKFYYYAKDENVKNIKAGKYLIFYNSDDKDGYKRAHVLSKFLQEDTARYRKPELDWLMDEIKGYEEHRGEKPRLIPGYISRLKQECYPTEMNFFKQKPTFAQAFSKLKKCIPENSKNFYFHEDVRYDVLEIDLLLNDEDINIKKLIMEKSGDEKYNIVLTNYDQSFSIGLYSIQTKIKKEEKITGELIIHLPDGDYEELEEDEVSFISERVRKNMFVTNMDIVGSVLLFICKCLGVQTVYLDDIRKEECPCSSEVISFINPIYLLADRGSLYSNLGFQNIEQEKLEEIMEEYRKTEIPIFVPEVKDDFSSSSSDTDEEEQTSPEVPKMNLKELSEFYLDRNCTYKNICDIMMTISYDIYENIPSRYILDLEKQTLQYYREFFPD